MRCASGVSRVALNVTGNDLSGLSRGSVLVTPSTWHFTDVTLVLPSLPGAVPAGPTEVQP